ncbi:nucleotidyltransferase family protein [Achromobacter marplatensis]|uniref:nucleotidyltransferase family protein n=1 Tax=Achromobacter marplatensis TaxID=470868 RepID=UPI0039F733FB
MTNPPPTPIVVVLAAGAGRRFREAGGVGNKLDADLLGRPVLEWTLAAVRDSGLPWILVERHDDAPEASGMGDSIARGVARHADAPGWLILPGDLPLIQPASLVGVAQSLREAALGEPWAVVRPQVAIADGTHPPGHPVGFGPAWRSALLNLSGESGAMPLVRRAAQLGTLRPLASQDAGCVQDIDHPDDIIRAEQALQSRPG